MKLEPEIDSNKEYKLKIINKENNYFLKFYNY